MKIYTPTEMEHYILVNGDNVEYINIIYKILRNCGLNMAKKGLFHWIPFYSKRSIRKDCQTKRVYVVWDDTLYDYTSTFQMNITADLCLYVSKIATLPKYEGRGIGRRNLIFMENYANANRCTKICLDVYQKSHRAVRFYEKAGFTIESLKRSLRFKEFGMSKFL